MSRINSRDVELMQYWESYLINSNWEEYNEDVCYCEWNFCNCPDKPAFCSKCKSQIEKNQSERCPSCKAFIC